MSSAFIKATSDTAVPMECAVTSTWTGIHCSDGALNWDGSSDSDYYDSDDSRNWDGSRDPEPISPRPNPDHKPDVIPFFPRTEESSDDEYDEEESVPVVSDDEDTFRVAAFEQQLPDDMSFDFAPASMYRDVVVNHLRNWRHLGKPIRVIMDAFRAEGIPIAKTSKKLLFKNAIALCDKLSAPALCGLVAQFSINYAEAATMYVTDQGEISQALPVQEPQVVYSVVTEEIPLTPAKLLQQYQAHAPLILGVCLMVLLAALVGKGLHVAISWMIAKCRKYYNARKFRNQNAKSFDLELITSYECLGVYNKMKGPDGAIHWVQQTPYVNSKESAQVGSIPLKTDKVPITLLKIFVNTEFIGMAVRYNDWLVATTHELAPITDKDKVTIMCVANGKTYDYTYKTAEFADEFTIVNTPFTDTSAIRIPNKVWSSLGVNGSVVPFKAHNGSTVSITAFGSTSYDVLTTFSSTGLIKINHLESEHTASTQRGWSGTPLYAGQYNAKQPQVVAIHHTGSKNSREGNTATIFLPIAMYLNKLRDAGKEDSGEYFAKNALSRFDSMAAEENRKNYYIDHTTDDVWYSDPQTFKTTRLDMEEYEAFMNNDRSYFEEALSERQRLREQNEDEERLMGEAISAPPVRGVSRRQENATPVTKKVISLSVPSVDDKMVKKSKKKALLKEPAAAETRKESALVPSTPVTDDKVMFEKFKQFMASNSKGIQKAQALPSQ